MYYDAKKVGSFGVVLSMLRYISLRALSWCVHCRTGPGNQRKVTSSQTWQANATTGN